MKHLQRVNPRATTAIPIKKNPASIDRPCRDISAILCAPPIARSPYGS